MDIYERRLELLKLAKEIALENNFLERQKKDEDWRANFSEKKPPYPDVSYINHKSIIETAVELEHFMLFGPRR